MGKKYKRYKADSWFIGFFFFKQKTAYEIVSRDWSSDVCSSDLPPKSKMLKTFCRHTKDEKPVAYVLN